MTQNVEGEAQQRKLVSMFSMALMGYPIHLFLVRGYDSQLVQAIECPPGRVARQSMIRGSRRLVFAGLGGTQNQQFA